MAIRKIAIATGTRADWGLLSPLARGLAGRTDCEVYILATNMHLLPAFGDTISEIRADGFSPIRVEMPLTTDTPEECVDAMAGCMSEMARAFAHIKPDLVVILGDRFEMLATATAALVCGVPIVHVAGGEISEGAIDDSIRHSITKMASLHLVATEPYRRRVIAMGEHPTRVINTGAIGVWNTLHAPRLSRAELEENLQFSLGDHCILATFHPATLDPADPADRCRAMLEAFDRFPGLNIIITYPNNDSRGAAIIPLIEEYGSRNPGRVKVIPSLGRLRYISALAQVDAVVGNSSSGIVEVPSMGIPTVDIGIRQQGRLRGDSVIHSADSADDIARAIGIALSPEFRHMAAEAINPYGRPDTLDLMVKAVALWPLEQLQNKKFYDITPL